MNFKKIFFSFFLFLILSNSINATLLISIEDKDNNKMNLEEILEYTFKNNDILNAEREKTKAVETIKSKVIGANIAPKIGLDLNYGYADFDQQFTIINLEDKGEVKNNKIYLQQPLFKSGRTTTQIKAVNQQIEMQKNYLSQREQEILFSTINSVINLLQSKEILDLTIKNEESFKNSYEYVKAKKNVGRSTSSDLSLAEARYSSSQTDTILAQTNYLNAKTNFIKLTKLNPDLIDINFEEMFKNIFSYTILFDQVLESALQKNPQFQIAKNNYQMNKENLKFAKTDFLPELYLDAQYGKSNTTDLIRETSASINLNLKVPLIQGGVKYSQHKEAGYLLNESKFTLNDIRETLMQQSLFTYDEFLSSKSLIVSSKAYRDASKLTLDSVIAEEKVGKSSIVDVLDRRKEYFDTEILFLKNKTNLINQYYTLRLLMGELNLIDLFIY